MSMNQISNGKIPEKWWKIVVAILSNYDVYIFIPLQKSANSKWKMVGKKVLCGDIETVCICQTSKIKPAMNDKETNQMKNLNEHTTGIVHLMWCGFSGIISLFTFFPSCSRASSRLLIVKNVNSLLTIQSWTKKKRRIIIMRKKPKNRANAFSICI